MYPVALEAGNVSEPMTLGSQPGSPCSPIGQGGHVHAGQGYLPGFLMGDSSASAPSPNPRPWGGLPGSVSPAKARTGLNLSILSGPSTPKPSYFSPGQFCSPMGSRELNPHPSSDKHGGPPVQGLFDHPLSASSSAGLRIASPVERPNQSGSVQNSFNLAPNSLTTSDSFVGTKKNLTRESFPPSPAQLDPFYSQGEDLKSGDELDECWLTVFGFPPAAASYILQQFYHYGNIVDHKMSPNGNWMHLRYQTKLQAKIALSKNGKVFTGNIMVGVAPCIDKSVVNLAAKMQSPLMSPAPENSINNCRNLSQPSVQNSPVSAAYKYATQGHTVASRATVPQKSSGFITQAMEYVFGW